MKMFRYFPGHYALSFKILRAIGGICTGQAEFGEIQQACERIDPNDADSWSDAWEAMGNRLFQMAKDAEAKRHFVTASGNYCRATGYYHNAQFFLDGDDPRRVTIYEKYRKCFLKGTAYHNPRPVEVHIPYGGTFLYAYFLPAVNPDPTGKTPAMVWFGGLDSTAEEAYFAVCLDYAKRGFHCLIVDGPGQGASLRLNHVYSCHDYEKAGTAAFDYLETRDDVDLNRVAVVAWSLGGYYAPRIVSFEHRYAACITYGAEYDYGKTWEKRIAAGTHALSAYAKWINGVNSMEEALDKFKKFTLEGVLQNVTCHVLITFGEDDPQQTLEGAERICKEMVNARSVTFKLFTKEEGGCCHVCADNLTLGNSYTADWLMDIFGMAPSAG